MAFNRHEVKEALTLEDIYELLDYFHAEPEYVQDYIIAKTICHNGIGEGSRKLYYYENSSLFQCYSGCSPASFDVFELIQKVKPEINDLNAAIYFVVNFFNLQSQLNEADDTEYTLEDWKIFNRYEKIAEKQHNDKIILPEYDMSIIKHYPQLPISSWIKDNISKEVCDYMGICYDPVNGCILIPHLDENGRCIGIRQRTLIQEQEEWGKYRPWKHGKTLYNSPLAFNLYGLYTAKDRIQEMQTAIVCESEKATLQFMSYFGTANNICVAVCGSSFSKYQFNLLYDLGVKEIVIGFDKDFQETGSEEWEKVIKKLENIYNKYSAYVNISFLFDKENNQLGYKDSPLDCGKDKFLYLFKNRVVL